MTGKRVNETEKLKMLRGELYDANDPELAAAQLRARRLLKRLNESFGQSREIRETILRELFGKVGERVWIEPPFYCDYGFNISLETGAYLNFNCIILDCNEVRIGEGTLVGPSVQIYTAYHPIEPVERRKGLELAAPIEIGSNAWIGGGAILCPGITIGDNTTIGAGSVVTKNIPSNVVAAGNPCRVLRTL